MIDVTIDHPSIRALSQEAFFLSRESCAFPRRRSRWIADQPLMGFSSRDGDARGFGLKPACAGDPAPSGAVSWDGSGERSSRQSRCRGSISCRVEMALDTSKASRSNTVSSNTLVPLPQARCESLSTALMPVSSPPWRTSGGRFPTGSWWERWAAPTGSRPRAPWDG